MMCACVCVYVCDVTFDWGSRDMLLMLNVEYVFYSVYSGFYWTFALSRTIRCFGVRWSLTKKLFSRGVGLELE